MAQNLSMVGIDRAKSALYLGRGLDDPARWCARRTACVPCLGVSGSVEPPHTALARLERPPDVAARILCLLSCTPPPGPRQGRCRAPDVARWAVGCAAWDVP